MGNVFDYINLLNEIQRRLDDRKIIVEGEGVESTADEQVIALLRMEIDKEMKQCSWLPTQERLLSHPPTLPSEGL